MRVLFVFECNKKSMSDYKYVRCLINEIFDAGKYKPITIFSGSKTNICTDKVERKIQEYKRKEENPNDLKVILFVDIDSGYAEDIERNKKITNYARTHGYEVVWFNRQIEEVFLGSLVKNTLKSKTAENFTFNSIVKDFKINMNTENPFSQYKKSNLLLVLNKYLPKKK